MVVGGQGKVGQSRAGQGVVGGHGRGMEWAGQGKVG